MRDKKAVLTKAFSESRKYGQFGRGITMFKTSDGPAFIKVVISGSVAQREVDARENLKKIERLGGTPVFSLLPNGGDYQGMRGYPSQES